MVATLYLMIEPCVGPLAVVAVAATLLRGTQAIGRGMEAMLDRSIDFFRGDR